MLLWRRVTEPSLNLRLAVIAGIVTNLAPVPCFPCAVFPRGIELSHPVWLLPLELLLNFTFYSVATYYVLQYFTSKTISKPTTPRLTH